MSARSASPTIPPLGEWGWIVSAGVIATAAEVGLRTIGLPRLSRLFGAPLQSDPGQEGSLSRPQLSQAERRRVRAAQRVMRHWPFGDTCLRQALVSGVLLRSRSPELVVGVAKVRTEVRAHAWLAIDGGVLDPMGYASSYVPLAPLQTGSEA